MVKLTKYAFRKESEQVAQDILGHEIVRRLPNGEEIRGYVHAVAPHSGRKLKSSDEGINEQAGRINVGKPKFGHRLMDITTEKEGNYSCVTIRGVVLADGTVIEGPGNFTKHFRIDDTVSGLSIENQHLYLTDRVDPDFDSENVQGPLNWSSKPKNSPGYFTYTF